MLLMKNVVTRTLLVSLPVILWAGCGAFAESTPTLDPDLAALFDKVSAGKDVAAADSAIAALANGDSSAHEWQAFFEDYFEERLFTPSLGGFWQYALHRAGEAKVQAARASAIAAAEAVQQGRRRVAASPSASEASSQEAAQQWLHRIRTELEPADFRPVFQILNRAVEKYPLSWPQDVVQRPGGHDVWLSVQTCLTIAAYAPPLGSGRETPNFAASPAFPASTRAFWRNHGLLLLDNGALDIAQLTSLDSLVRAFPRDLLDTAAFVVPEALGLNAANHGLSLSGPLVIVRPAPMNLPTNSEEFFLRGERPTAPVFTVNAAASIVRAVQTTQFARRPGLRLRRDIILASARAEKGHYLRKDIPPAFYLEHPDELLPATAFLWFINSEATFRMAAELFDVKIGDPIDTALLLADLLSGGHGMTRLFRTDEAGIVSFADAPIGRSPAPVIAPPATVPPQAPLALQFVTAIDIRGHRWTFELDEQGRTRRGRRR